MYNSFLDLPHSLMRRENFGEVVQALGHHKFTGRYSLTTREVFHNEKLIYDYFSWKLEALKPGSCEDEVKREG